MQTLNTVARLAAAAAVLTAMPAHAQATAAPASSNVTIYGLIDAAVRRASNATADGDATTDMVDGMVTGSRLGFRGNEDLGGGWRALFTLESGFHPAAGTSLQGTATADYGQEAATPRFWGRMVHVGLRSPWGRVTLGRQYTVAHQIAAGFQPLGNPNNPALSVFSSHHIPRQDNMVRLDSKLGGVDLQASHTLGEQGSSSANSAWAVGAGYKAGGLALGGYVQQMKNREGTETRKIVGVGGNYRFGPAFSLYSGYMQRSAEVGAQRNKVLALGAKYEATPAVTLSAEHFNDRQSGSDALDGSRKVTWVSASYRFSRRTDVYAMLDHNRIAGGYTKPGFMGTPGSQTGTSVGLRHNF